MEESEDSVHAEVGRYKKKVGGWGIGEGTGRGSGFWGPNLRRRRSKKKGGVPRRVAGEEWAENSGL